MLALFAMASSVFSQEETIADIVAGNEDFSTLLTAVEAADPSVLEALSNPEADLTVFAPTNDAFAALPDFVIEYLTTTNTELLTQTLLYHVVDGSVMSTDVLGLVDESGMAMVPTLQGAELTVNADLDNMIVRIDGATINLEMVDIEAANGVIHVIDAVLVPPIELEFEDPAFVEGTITSAGSSTVGPLTEAIMAQYRADAGGDDAAIELTNDITGSGTGFDRFCGELTTDFSNASRPIQPDEVELCESNGLNPVEFRVGTDALAVVVNPEADWVEDVTVEELAALVGTATTWSDVREDWPDEEIIRYTPGSESGTFDFFNEVVFDEDASIPEAASNRTTNSDDNVLLLGVAENPYAIGYFGFAYFTNNSDQLKALSVNGVEPSAESVEATGDDAYPLARPLFIYSAPTKFEENAALGEFIKYYLETVNDVIGEVGYFPANPFGLRVAKLTVLALTDMGM
jgi:phosphate transport system substrate-binding protein